MNRGEFLALSAALLNWEAGGLATPQPIPEPHFPSRLYLFVWRNSELANVDRMAGLVRARPRDILELGESRGLSRKPELTVDQLKRVYVTVLRQNWRVLPNSQIIELLGSTPEQFAFHLRRDDYLWIALGPKPECAELVYRPLSANQREQAAGIRAIVRASIGPDLEAPGEAPAQFYMR